MRHKVKRIIRAAGLRDELSFTSFRHGGFTEAADADLTDAEIRAQGRHRSAKVAVGVSRSEDLRPMRANGFVVGSLLGLRRAATFQARRQVFMA